MRITENKTYCNDLKLVSSNLLDKHVFKNKSILITGATGLICSAVIDLLMYINITTGIGINIFAAGRNERKMQERFGTAEHLYFLNYDANEAIHLDEQFNYIIHGASNAHPASMMKYPVETMKANIIGVNNLLEYARVCKVERLLYISSSEVYGRKESIAPIKEDEYGFIDILDPRSSYPISKRAGETLCVSHLHEYGVDSVIARPGHVYGPTATEKDNRISSAFAYFAARGEDLMMKSEGMQIRSYCYCLDCATALLAILTRGISGEAYNISNKASIITIRQMVEILADVGKVKVRFEIPNETEKRAFNPMNNSSLDSRKLESLGWSGIFDAQLGLSHTVEVLKELTQLSNPQKGIAP